MYLLIQLAVEERHRAVEQAAMAAQVETSHLK